MFLNRITKQLIKHEGLQTKIYKCPAGKLTIGVGRNLEDRGITKQEAEYLLNNDILTTHNELSCSLKFYDELDDVRQEVLINMAFQMGVQGLLKFKKTLDYIRQALFVQSCGVLEHDYFDLASDEMMDSQWALQTPNRARELSNLMKGGQNNVESSAN